MGIQKLVGVACSGAFYISFLSAYVPGFSFRSHRCKKGRPIREHFTSDRVSLYATASKGSKKASGGGFGTKSVSAKTPKNNKQGMLKRLEQTYGGTSSQEIAAATEKRVEQAFRTLPPHLQVATQLYQQLQKWNSQVARLTILQQAQLPPSDVEGAQRAQQELDRIYKENNFTEVYLHNLFQRITWDASADFKAARSILGEMPLDIANRVDRACAIIAEAVQAAGRDGRCLDVGCGFGVLVPHLSKAGVKRRQIVGVDLSGEMIRNAQELYPDVTFTAEDFLNDFKESSGFDGVIFCSALHDLPDPLAALEKAAHLLRPNGKLVIVHPQGASHVLKQAMQNPILVKRGLPDSTELESLSSLGLDLFVRPSPAGSTQESTEGYLAVLQKRR